MKKLNISYLDYVICTHPHEDHVGGLSGALNAAGAGMVFCPVSDYESKAFESFVKYVNKRGLELTYPSVGNSLPLGSAEIDFIGPQMDYEDMNDLSIVVRIVNGDTSFLFMGDAERAAERDIAELSNYSISSTVLKVGHHGSDTSSSYVFLREVMPDYAVISVGANNDYGHPHDGTMSRLRDADVKVYRTDIHGSIICSSDGKNVSFVFEKADPSPVNSHPVASEETEYIGNINSLVFHLPSCDSLPLEKNRVYFNSRRQAVEQEFTPCDRCKP